MRLENEKRSSRLEIGKASACCRGGWGVGIGFRMDSHGGVGNSMFGVL